jgi:hypothetical protein
MAETAAKAEKAAPVQVYLEADDEIRGQKYICLSFLSPEKVLAKKEIFFFSKFLEFYAMEYKVTATESFLMGKLKEIQSVLSDVELHLENGATDKKTLVDQVSKARATLASTTAADLEAHVKANLSDFKTNTLQESYERYMLLHKTRLEDEFHKAGHFQTSIRGLKCRGVYGSYDQATARAQHLHKKDPYFNVYVAEMGAWLPWDPEPEEVPEQQYSNDQLNKLMGSYRENAAKRDAFFEEEKRQKIATANAEAAAAKAKHYPAIETKEEPKVTPSEIAKTLFEGVSADLVLDKKAAADTITLE